MALLLATGCGVGPDHPAEPDPPGSDPVEREVSFDSGPDTVYGTLALPETAADARSRAHSSSPGAAPPTATATASCARAPTPT